MKKLLLAFLMAVGLACTSGCYAVVYDEPPVNAYAYPHDAVLVAPGVYYRTVVVEGIPHRFYYRYHPGYGWRYHNRVRVMVVR